MAKNRLHQTQRILVLLALLFPMLTSYAVKPDEMERARAVAACVYLRYTNDKSDYLDGFKPHSMADVRAKVSGHAEDEENLKKFMNVTVSNDFDTWDKEELVNYWGNEFFRNSNLSDKGAKARNNKIIARLRTMDVTPPSAEPASLPEAEQTPVQTPYNGYQDVNMQTAQQPAPVAVDTAQTVVEEEKVVTQEKSNNNWTLIVILVILIIIVVCLVAYAMRALRGNNGRNADTRNNNGFEPQQRMVIDNQDEMPRQQPAKLHNEYMPRPTAPDNSNELKYARAIQQKNEMIESLRAQLDEARDLAREQRALADRLQAELNTLREEQERQRMPRPVSPLPAPGRPLPGDSPRPRRYEPQTQPSSVSAHNDREMVIYLGRANSDKVFVRADKQITRGKTIYRLVTTNGITGSFYVESDPSVVGWVSLDPQTALYGACEVPTFANADTFTRIITDTAGTAIFEDGCWKVLRPAAVHLE